jgi:RNA polymerase sigma-70 factor (ECF subfamily)
MSQLMERRSDEVLIREIAAGDQSAFAEFYDYHAPRVLGALAKWLTDRGAAEDVLQETFWQVWSRASQYDAARSTPEVWLFVIARSRALDHLRRHKPEVSADGPREPVLLEDPAAALESNEAMEQIRKAMAQLPEEQRSAIRLAFYTGLTYEQVAQSQAIPVGTAKTRIRLGMKRLRDLLRD